MLLAFANRIHAGFAEHQRQLAGLSHQMRQVAAEVFLAMQIHVERNEIEKTQIEIFGRRIVRVGEKRAGIDLFAEVTQLGEEAADGARPVPAHDVRANLVADAVGGDRLAELARVENRLADGVADFAHHVGANRETPCGTATGCRASCAVRPSAPPRPSTTAAERRGESRWRRAGSSGRSRRRRARARDIFRRGNSAQTARTKRRGCRTFARRRGGTFRAVRAEP